MPIGAVLAECVRDVHPQAFGFPHYSMRAVASVTHGSTYWMTSHPAPGASEDFIVASKLGNSGFGRVSAFREYQHGWDGGRAQPMSEIAYRNLCDFLRVVTLPLGKRPSVFLTTSGNLELAWEDHSGQRFQAEFGPATVEFYREDSGAEGLVPMSELGNVAAQLSV